MFLWSSSPLSMSESTQGVSPVCSKRKSVRDHRASVVSFASSSLLCERPLPLPLANEPFLSTDIHLTQSTGLCSSRAFREHHPHWCHCHRGLPYSPTALSITATSMRLPCPPGTPAATHESSWVLQQLGHRSPGVCCKVRDVPLRFLCISCAVCICPNVFRETTLFRFCYNSPLHSGKLKPKYKRGLGWRINPSNPHTLRISLPLWMPMVLILAQACSYWFRFF